MIATADIQFVPIGSGVSVRKEISRVIEMINARDFIVQSHAMGTNIEGELHEILAVVAQIHEALHREGTVRVLSNLKLETRTDKIPTLAGKKL
ncbi:MAG: MTH1187 family thiamine-binding protein [Gammaproteobacteria bacterium]|nr:MTH1187 family thiamine-binding protein [Gammaproteobacteria bacterium]